MKTIKERIEDIYKQIPFLETIKDPNVKKVVNILKKDIRNILNNQEKLEKLEHLIKKYKTISVYKNALEIEKKCTQQQRETEKVAQHETIVIYSSDEETDKTKDSTDDHQQYLIPPNKIKKEKLNDFKDTREKEEILFTRRKKSTESNITTVIEIIDSEDEVLTNSNHTLVKQNISVDNLKLELNENENSFNDELKNKSIRELEQIALNILKVGTNRNNTNPDSTSVDIRENFVENSSKSLIISQNVITPTANNLYTAVVPDQIFNIGSEINQIVRYNTPTPNIQVQAMSTTTDFSPTIYHQIPLNSYSSNTLFSSNSEISIENNQFCNIQHNIVDSTHSTNLCYNENFISASQNSESVIMPNCNKRKNLISNTADTSQPVSTTRKRKSSKDEDLSNKSENCSSNRQFNSKKLKSNILTDSTCTDNIVITNVRSINENEEKQKQMTTDDNEHKISSKPAKITRRRFTYHASDLNKVKESNDTSITQKVKQPQKMKGRRKSVCSHLENDVNLRELHGLQEQFLNWGYTLPEPKTHRPAFNKALQKIRRHSKVWDEEEIADLLSDEEIRKPKQSRRKSVCISEPEFENNRNSKDKNSALNISATARSKENEEKERSGKENKKIFLKKINCETSENCNSNQLKDLQFEVTAASNITKLDEVIETKSKISNTPKIIFRNTDQNLHCYNKNFMSKCVICDKTVNSIVSHYVNNHNNIKNHEIYCSRLPYYLIEKYKKKILEAKLIKVIQLKYRCKCAFCDKQIYGAPSDFYEHYSMHTGEYAWECDKCCKKLPHETKMIEHCEHCKKGGNPKRIYAYQEQSEVVGSFCAECKFIQLNKSNVIKHLENHHSIAREPERLCESLVLVKFSEKAKMTNIEEIFEKNFSELNTESFTEQKFNKPNSQELITVLNEPVCDYINNDKSYRILKSDSMNESSEKRSKCTLTGPVEIVTLPVLSEMYMMKPWLNNDNIDEKKSFSILSKINLLNFFKCMMCTFSTNCADQMQNHFKSHKSINLECCYCNVVLNRPPDLIKHMKIYHAPCNFQCSSCFYRSYSAFHVKIHIKKYHKKTSKIIVCDGPELSMNALFKVIIESRERYLKPYTCHLCNEGKCYLQEDLRDHFKRNHYNSVFCNCDYHGLFCCFFCHFETDSIELIEIHMADIHAEKGLFVGARLRNQKLEKHKKSIQLYDKFKMNSTVIIDLSNILHEDQFLESTFLKQKMKRISENMEDFKKIAENANETVWSSDDYTSKYLIKYSSSSKENLDRFTRNNSLEKLEKNFQKFTKLIVSSLNDKDLKHPYFCYLCGICTTSLSKLENHFSIEHKILQIKSEKLEQYFIGIPNEINYNRLTLLIHIVNVLDLKKHDIKNKNKSKSNSHKKLLQLPKFIPLEKGRYKCFEKNCPYGTQSESLFFESHLKLIHRSIKRFECIHCNFKIDKVTCDFNDIKNHLRMHSEILYTCTICFFYNHQRQIVQKHVRLMHKVEMNITNVIRSQKHDIEEYSFTTCLKENEKILKQHFCLICGIDTIKPKNFIKHLDKDHSIIIMYECQYCNNLYNVLDKIIEHSNKDHKKPLKIRCEYEYKKNIDHTNENFNESIDEHSSKSKTSKKYSRKEKK